MNRSRDGYELRLYDWDGGLPEEDDLVACPRFFPYSPGMDFPETLLLLQGPHACAAGNYSPNIPYSIYIYQEYTF